jgi:hypothetical protein
MIYRNWTDEQVADPVFVASKVRLWSESFWDWFIDNVFTTDESDSENPVKPAPQFRYLKEIHRIEEENKVVVVCKSRRMFISHFEYAKILWSFLFVPFSKNLIISKKENDVKEGLRNRILSMYYRLDKRFPCHVELKPRRDIHEMEILHPDRNFGSHILGLPSGANQIRSYTATRVLIDELAFHEKRAQEETMSGLQPAIYGPSGKATLVSTPLADTKFEELVSELDPNVPIQEVMQGLTVARNKLGYTVVFLKYLADPSKRTQQWFYKERYGTTVEGVPIPGAAGYDEYTWRKEMELSFDFPVGQPVVPEFKRETHCTPYTTYGQLYKDRALEIGIDFGSNFPAAVFAQKDPLNRLIIHHAIMPEFTNIDRFLQMVDQIRLERFGDIEEWNIYCDPAGAAKPGQGQEFSAVQTLHQKFKKVPKYRMSSPADRARGIRKLASELVGPCPGLIVNPLSGVYITQDGKEYPGQIAKALEFGWVYDEARADKLTPKKDMFFEHLMDAFGYMFIYLYPHLISKEPSVRHGRVLKKFKKKTLRR